MRKSLKHPYIAVYEPDSENGSYGGSQTFCKSAVWRESACGVIAGTDLLLYLSRYRSARRAASVDDILSKNRIEKPEYLKVVDWFGRRFFPVIPKLGIVGWFLAGGMDLYFRIYGIPLRVTWGVLHRNLWKRMEEMLEADIPVILGIGPNVPIRWGRHKVNLYQRAGNRYRAAARTSGHYVTVTGMDDTWLRISSWGREYFIRKEEFWQYAQKHSSFLVSNIAYIREIKK